MGPIEKIAKQIAIEAHKGQTRRGGEPYIVHPQAVANALEQYYLMREIYLPTAWLHDVLEDTPLTPLDLLQKGIPFEVVEAVVTLTKKDDEDYLQYILRVKRNHIAKIVKIADMKDNQKSESTKSQIVKYSLAEWILLN